MYELAVYSWSTCKRKKIGVKTGQEEILSLNAVELGITRDVELCFYMIQDEVYVKESSDYRLIYNNELLGKQALSEGIILFLYTDKGQELILLVQTGRNSIQPMKKYDISMLRDVKIGSLESNDIVISGPAISQSHIVLLHEKSGWIVQDISSNGTYLNGSRIKENSALHGGDIIDLFDAEIIFCNTFIAVREAGTELKFGTKVKEYTFHALERGQKRREEGHYFHRSPRSFRIPEMESVTIDNPPMKQVVEKKPLFMVIGSSFTMMIPMMLGSVLAIYSYKKSGTSTGLMMYIGIVTAFASAVIGIFWALLNLRYSKKAADANEIHRIQMYEKYLKEQAEKLENSKESLREAMLEMYASAQKCTLYNEASTELWNRNRNHEDFLYERLGLGDLDIGRYIEIPKERFELHEDELLKKPLELKKASAIVTGIPQGVDLAKEGIVGIIGENGKKEAFEMARILITQIAANNCYTDVKMAFAYDAKKDGAEWEQYRWLPHVWSSDYRRRYVASNREESRELFVELLDVLRDRKQDSYAEKKVVYTHIVLFVSDISLLEGELLLNYISENAGQYAFSVITLSERYEELLNNCTYTLISGSDFQGIHLLKEDKRCGIAFDKVAELELAGFTKRLATIKVNEEENGSGLPETLSFFDMYKVRTLQEFGVLERWNRNRTYNSLNAVIGQKAGGKDCFLDVHEKYHGPHGLVAGTTGSGKSETLQTYLLSLALNYSPDDIGFFIIDYKGGGMANLFDKLPHMIGAISNLSGNSIRRAMVSIKSENRRRQQVFNEAGVNNINSYTKLVKNGEVDLAVPHLFIVVDEFAELKREQPDFMKELISVAQVGRSLGVHLILATQKPAGTVDDNIWSNSKFKLCLRVQDKQDSKDMLHKDDAAFITQTGRGYLQVGNDELYELFQSGWSGAEYHKEAARESSLAGMLSLLGTETRKKKKSVQAKSSAKAVTQLEAICSYLAEIAKENGYCRDYSLWIPPISNPLYLDSVKMLMPQEKETGEFYLSSAVGLCDDPENQRQLPFNVDFTKNSHLAVCGTVVSGKSTFLQTLICSMIQKYNPNELNLYVADFSNKSLLCFERAPQVGGIVCEEETDRIKKLFYMMETMMNARKKILGGVNYHAYIRAHGKVLPAIVLVIDNYTGFREKAGDAYESAIIHLAHDGAAYGMYLVITANGIGTNGIPGRVADNITENIALVMNDRYQYSEILHTGRIEVFPEELKGRGLVKLDDKILEFQTALAIREEDEVERMAQIKVLCESIAQKWSGAFAERIPSIPEKPLWYEFAARKDVLKMFQSRDTLPVGYDEASAEPYGVELSRTYCYFVSGRARTGKKNMMRLLMRSAAETSGKVIVIENSGNEFSQITDELSALYLNSEEKQAEFFTELLPSFVERNKKKNQLKEKGFDDNEIYREMKVFEAMYIFIADINSFMESLYHPSEGITVIRPFIENIMDKGSLHNIYFIAASDTKTVSALRGYYAYESMTGYHTGIQLGGNASESGYLDFSNLSYTEQNKPYKPGIGMIPLDNDESGVTQIVIPQDRREINYGGN